MASKPMTKSALLARLAEETGNTKAGVEKLLEALSEIIRKELQAGGAVTLPGIAKFLVRERAARTARNPNTGAAVAVPAGKVVKAVLLKELKDTSVS